ncbi:WD40 repeat domain-containing serine/threonine protein kinase [Nonomuraea zeae]|uniref:Protein kinase domain-containing protein n=1 Tax=Nonomuraea zeae TaxID=1642303 RepID=A0A5S4GGS7_9ACTN|nr:WD40 repeat domain-containing serine/threonine protein kinase [Nonomuraea zeae]TMR32166.1 hypothetical protein ETD85_23670 [Nonomuraea zeae]
MRPLHPNDPERIGGYRLAGVLGSGGQGVVYRATGDDGREVAVKLLHDHLSHDDGIAKGFLREAEAARRVAAFCTAAVLDVGMLDDRPYIVSEYIPGETLQSLVRSAGPRTGGALDRLAISTLTALAAIHQAGIVHRDFKPANVLMGPDGPIVIDFGIAKALDATTRTSGPVGTPAYMSPEQFRGERVGPESDVFGWAGTLVFAATGRPPFAGDTVAAIVNGVLSGTARLEGVPAHLLGVIESCLAKDPLSRPTPAGLLQQLIRQAGPASRSAVSPATPGQASPNRSGPVGPAIPAPARPTHLGPVGPATPDPARPTHSTPQGPAVADPMGSGLPASRSAGPAVPSSPPWGAPRTGVPSRGPGVPDSPHESRPGAGPIGPAIPSSARAGAVPAGTVLPQPGAPGAGAESTTAPGRARPVSRRALIGGLAAASVAGVAAYAALRQGGDALWPDGGVTDRPTGGPTGRATVSGSATADPTGNASPAASPDVSASAEPFGTQVVEPVSLPGASGAPAALAAAIVTGAGVPDGTATSGTAAAGRSAVVCGTDKGVVLGWELGAAAVARLGDGGGSATSVAAGTVDGLAGGRPVAASGHADGTMRLWSLTGESLATHRATDPILAVTITGPADAGQAGGGRAVAVSQKYDGMTDLHSVVRLWDIATGKQLGPAITDHFQGIRGLAFGRLGDHDVLVTGDGGERVRVRRLSTGRMTHSFRTGEIGGIELLACGEIKGKPVLVSTHLDATLRVYDLATGKRRKKWTFSDQSPDDRGATALVAGRLGDTPIAAVAHAPAGGDVIVRVWNLDDGEILGVLGPGPGGAIRTLALAEHAGQPVIVGAGDDGLLRSWSLGPI